MKPIEVSSKVLDGAIGRVIHAVAKEEARPILTCALFEGDLTGLRLVAADNYRIAIADVDHEDWSALGKINVPRDQLVILRAFLAKQNRTVALSHDSNVLTATDATDTVILRLLNGTFPNYRAAITDVPVARSQVNVNQRYLLDTLRALKNELSTRIELPDSELQTIYVKADGYSEYIMPVKAIASAYGSSVDKAA